MTGLTTATVDGESFRQYLDAVHALTDEARIHMSPNGLTTKAVDAANVAMVHADLSREAFTDKPERAVTIGAKVFKLAAVLNDDADSYELEFDAERRKLTIRDGERYYTHATMDPDALRMEPDIQDMNLPFKATVNSETVRETIHFFDEFSHHARIGYDSVEGCFWMEAVENDGTDDGGLSIPRADLPAVDRNGEADSIFSLDYFTSLLEGVPEDVLTYIEVGEAFPMRLSFALPAGEVEYMQAPRIDNE